MKLNLSKACLCVSLICLFVFSQAQQASTTPAKSTSDRLHDEQVKKANDLTQRIASSINITEEQKTKLQASMLEAMVKFNDALLKAKKEDEARLPSLNQELLTDINARLKTILTPEQFKLMMDREESK